MREEAKRWLEHISRLVQRHSKDVAGADEIMEEVKSLVRRLASEGEGEREADVYCTYCGQRVALNEHSLRLGAHLPCIGLHAGLWPRRTPPSHPAPSEGVREYPCGCREWLDGVRCGEHVGKPFAETPFAHPAPEPDRAKLGWRAPAAVLKSFNDGPFAGGWTDGGPLNDPDCKHCVAGCTCRIAIPPAGREAERQYIIWTCSCGALAALQQQHRSLCGECGGSICWNRGTHPAS